MNKRIKKLWIKALRSGRFKQAQGQLRKDGSFCCLGVLCDLHRQAYHKRWGRDMSDNYAYEGSSHVLPEPVIEWAGLKEDDPKLGHIRRAARLNDEGKSFNFIADRIEKYL